MSWTFLVLAPRRSDHVIGRKGAKTRVGESTPLVPPATFSRVSPSDGCSDRIRLKRICVERPQIYRMGFSRFKFVEEVAELSANDGDRSREFNDPTDRVGPFCRQFADKHLLRSERTQKMFDSPFKGLSNGIRMNEIQSKTTKILIFKRRLLQSVTLTDLIHSN